MKYFFYASKHWLDFDKAEKYLEEHYNDGVAKVVFDDSQHADFIKTVNLSEYDKYQENFSVFGYDGYIYDLTMTGTVKRNKIQSNDLKQILKCQKTNYKKYLKCLEFKENALNDFKGSCVIKKSIGIGGYDKYVYINKNADFVIPFRFKTAEKKNQPLVVYFGGGGTVGCDNYNQLREFLFYTKGTDVSKADCNILCPQMILGIKAETDSESKEIFTDNTVLLIEHLLKNYDIDSKRVYVYGTSLGAGCVWTALIRNTDLFAAAVEAMGCYFPYKLLDDDKFKELSAVPIYMTHSSDDTVVDIASDDYFYDKLKALDADVKYLRWDKYGHGMSYKFYRQEPWLDWLLSKYK